MYYIYKITNLNNNKVYIGIAECVTSRWAQHIKNSSSKSLAEDIKVDGIQSFSFQILKTFQTKIDAHKEEAKLIKFFCSVFPSGYNTHCSDMDMEAIAEILNHLYKEKLSIKEFSIFSGIPYSTLYSIFIKKERTLSDKNRLKINSTLKTKF